MMVMSHTIGDTEKSMRDSLSLIGDVGHERDEFIGHKIGCQSGFCKHFLNFYGL